MHSTVPQNFKLQGLQKIAPETTEMELAVMGWFAHGHEVLWIPIYEVSQGPNGLADANAEMSHFGGYKLLNDVTDLFHLPLGIKGWLFPAHLDDTEVICIRNTPGEISIGGLVHPVTGQRLTYRYHTEAPVRRQSLCWCEQSDS